MNHGFCRMDGEKKLSRSNFSLAAGKKEKEKQLLKFFHSAAQWNFIGEILRGERKEKTRQTRRSKPVRIRGLQASAWPPEWKKKEEKRKRRKRPTLWAGHSSLSKNGSPACVRIKKEGRGGGDRWR